FGLLNQKRMTPSELLHIRLYNQLLAMHSLTEPREVVAWMGAMQAQALEMPKKTLSLFHPEVERLEKFYT
ncbi:MAG TPA: hypothetical protein DD786_10380, partial [Porphyromonadaceae bacterium]|nr:hypothetical protein [Porphyromonadaceae bacterium]